MFGRRQQTQPQPIEPDTLLNDRYRLLEQLGEGGAGVVFKATDEQLSRIVAIKVLTGGSTITEDKLARFQSEARSVARLNHPNIITLYDYAEDHGRPYLVIEYIPGLDLWELDNQYAPSLMPFDVALPIVDGVLAALEYSHSHHVIHRDLKPENVMITPEKQVKVMDFGLARIEGQSRLTQHGLVAGTAAYLAPELAQGDSGDHRADLYALGVIIYELTTGRRPFSGDDPLTVVSQHIHAPVVPPQHYNAAVPNDLQAVVMKLLAKNPDERYAAAAAARHDLAPILTRLRSGGLDPDGLDPGGLDSEAEPGQTLEPAVEQGPADATLLLDRIVRGKIIGREQELQRLKEYWDEVRLGALVSQPLVVISGEAGIGKTRLLREAQVYAGLRDGYILYGLAHEQDAGTPYTVFAALLRNYVREQPADVLQRQLTGYMAGEIVKIAPQLTEKLGPIQPNPALEPSAERARLLDQVTGFILNIAFDQPALIMIDDLHFTDPSSLDILDALVKQAAGASLMIAAAYRNVALSYDHPVNRFVSSLRTLNLVSQIELNRLPQNAVRQMLESLLGSKVSRRFLMSVYDATEGNPLFVEELIKSLAVDGQIRLLEGRWEQRSTTLNYIPGSIKSVLGRRLERIKPRTLDLLRLGAAIGRRFGLDLLIHASPENDETIQWSIEEALAAQLIEVVNIVDEPLSSQNTGIDVYYQFQHALIRETLYDDLRPLRRRLLHKRIAASMKTLHEAGLAINPAVIARHLIAAAQDEQAVPYLRLAGEQAHRYYTNHEAIEYFQQAREILEDLAPDLSGEQLHANLVDRFELLSLQRDVSNMMGDRDREFAVLQELLNLADLLADRQRWVGVMTRMSTYYWHIGQLDQAEETARQALRIAREDNNRRGQQSALERIARVLWTQRSERSMEYATQSLALAQEIEDRAHEGRLSGLVGQIFIDTLYEPERAELYLALALDICREINNPYEEAWTLWGLGKKEMLVNNYVGALDRFAQAKKVAEEIGATLQVGWDVYHSGLAYYNLGDYERCLELCWQAQEVFTTSLHPRGQIYVHGSIGLAYIAMGQLNEAEAALKQAVQQAEERQDHRLMMRSYEAMAYYFLRRNTDRDLSNGVRLTNRLIKLAEQEQYVEHQIIGHYLRSSSLFSLRRLQEATDGSSRAVTLLESLRYLESPQVTLAQIWYTHGRICGAMGQQDTTRRYLRRAYNEMMRTADLIPDDSLRDQFLKIPLNQEIIAAGQS